MAMQDDQYFTFKLNGEDFGIEILRVREIQEYREITVVPRTPSHIAGVLNLRGQVIPIIDLNRFFSGEKTEVKRKTCIVVLEIPGEDQDIPVAILVDSVNEVVSIEDENIDPPPSFGSRIQTDFIKGMGRIKNDVIILLNVKSLMNLENLGALSGVDLTELKRSSEMVASASESKS